MRRVLPAALVMALGLTAAAMGLDRTFPPPLAQAEDISRAVLDRRGEPLRLFANNAGHWRLPTTAGEVAPLYLTMLTAVEDGRFYAHPGIDPLALGRAVRQNLVAGRVVSGASTLSMQVARLLEPRPRTLVSKLVEALRALQLEARLGKEGVLDLYLTLAPMGGNLDGVRAASRAYFGKEPAALDAAEAALLVALPRSPTRLRPDRDAAAAQAARDAVLARAEAGGLIDARAYAEAVAEPVPTARADWPFAAPHLADRALAARPGVASVRTTLGRDLQRGTEALAARIKGTLPSQAGLALLVVDNASGEVRASVGSPNYFDAARRGAIDMTRAVRSPGSTLKPFIYGMAFDERIVTPATLVEDVSTRFGAYAPHNFDEGFHGELTVRDALLRSLNIPAVLVLDRLGPGRFVRAIARVGVRLELGEDADAPGLPVALGGVGTTLEDLVSLYRSLANGGRVGRLRWLADDPASAQATLLSSTAAREVRDILVEARPAAGVLPAGLGGGRRAVAAKTGTSYGFRDAWAIGVSRRWSVGVWVGRPDGTPLPEATGRTAALPVLYQAFDLLSAEPDGGLRHDALPPRPPSLLRRIEAGPGDAVRLPDPDRLRLVFPEAGSTLDATDDAGAPMPLALIAKGGQRPFSWLVDGRPLSDAQGRQAELLPQRIGPVRITVIDSQGRSDSAEVVLR